VVISRQAALIADQVVITRASGAARSAPFSAGAAQIGERVTQRRDLAATSM
jgi:hypothetical protein